MNPIKKDRKTYISEAINILKESYPDFNAPYFQRVSVQQSKDGKIVLVDFSNPINYIPINLCAYYSGLVQFGDSIVTSCRMESNPSKFLVNKPQFYYHSKSDLDQIVKVMKAFDKEPNDVPDFETYRIYDRTSYYEIVLTTSCSKGIYNLDKKSGVLTVIADRELIPNDKYIEMP